MKRLSTYEEYTGIVGRVFQKIRFDTNNLNTTQGIKKKIKNGAVYCEEGDFGAWILTDVGNYYLATIYLIKGKILPKPPDMEKTILAELIGTKKRYGYELESVLQEVGFCKYAKNLELVSSKEDVGKLTKNVDVGKRIFSKHGFIFHDMSELNETYFQDIFSFWKKVIDPYAIHALTENDYRLLRDNDRGIFVTDAKGEVAGAGYYEKEGNVGYAHHIAVKSEYNGLGLGGVVMNACAEKAFREKIEKYISWIAEDNEESIRIHKRMGKFTGKFSQQFLLQKERRK